MVISLSFYDKRKWLEPTFYSLHLVQIGHISINYVGRLTSKQAIIEEIRFNMKISRQVVQFFVKSIWLQSSLKIQDNNFDILSLLDKGV